MQLRKESCLLAMLLLLISLKLSAVTAGEQYVIQSGSWLYDAIDTLAMETGSVTFTGNSQPLSVAEFRLYLESIDYDLLSSSGKNKYDEILAELSHEWFGITSGVVSAGMEPAFQPEVFFKTNENIGWVHDYKQRQKVIVLPLRISAGKYVSLFSDYFFSQNVAASKDNSIYTNIPFNGSSFSAEFPMTTGASFGAYIKDTPFLNFQIGSGSFILFKTQMDSVVISDNMEGVNYARFSLFSPKVRYTMLPMQLDVNKYFYVHQLEFHPFARFSVSIVEGVLVNAPIELRYFDPLIVYHRYSAWLDYTQYNRENKIDYSSYDDSISRVGSLFAIHFNLNPWKYMRLYGIFTFNQFQTAYEKAVYPDSALIVPDSLAYQAGIESYIPFNNGYWYAGIEGLYTSPWMYICDEPGWSFYREYDELVGSDNVKNWTGSSFGPDSIAAQIKGGYEAKNRKWSLYLSYRFVAHGEQSFDLFDEVETEGANKGKYTYYPDSIEEASWISPHGIPEYTNRIALEGSVKCFQWCTLKCQTVYSAIFNNGNLLGQNAQGFEISISASLKAASKKNSF